ncbi:membrane hypothetical protein [Verrucomicrobia bacterium]|nr:membrane hypothetical protein [Verrucomicrobiota bacterium]
MGDVWGRADQPAGPLRTWADNVFLFAAAGVLSFTATAVSILLAFPELNANPGQRLLLAARVAGVTGVSALVLLAPTVALGRTAASRQGGGRPMLVLLGLLVEGAAIVILLNGLRFVGGVFVGFRSCVYVMILTLPAVVLLCRRAAASQKSLAEALLSYGRLAPRRHARRRLVGGLIWVTALAGTVWLAARAHLYYEWGFATASFYSAITVACVWGLLTMLPRAVQAALSGLCLIGSVLGLLTFVLPLNLSQPWNTYLKFDKTFGTVVHAYYDHFPRPEPVFQRARQLLEDSHSRVPSDLRWVQRQELVLRPISPRPNVFFIVADALRGETYGASAEQRRHYPGVTWMLPRFAVYDNAWTSYNSTRGSYPAYLNGRMQPAWYHYYWSYPVRQDNVLARACALAGYQCYNFATFSEDFSSCWPTNSCVALHPGGQGLGDPGVVFPQALEELDAHRAKAPKQPAFFYLHLFNNHQPLQRRPGIPLDHHGVYFMRGLYEQNAAYFDQQLLAFLQGLEQRGVMDNSMIVISADHGEELFELGGVYHGWQINPWVMHVPLFIHYPLSAPAAPGAGIRSRPVNLIDLAPTICQAMGAEIVRNSPWQGVSLLQHEPAQSRSFLLLSWKNPVVGQLSFSPFRMVVLDLNSGEEQTFGPAEQRWTPEAGCVPAAELAEGINKRLEGLFNYWQLAAF